VVIAAAGAAIAGGASNVSSPTWSPARALTWLRVHRRPRPRSPRQRWSAARHLLAPSGAESISVELSGFALVTNGSVHRTAAGFGTPPRFGPRLVAQLEHFVGAPATPRLR
jgi:hypothetical protein